MSAGTSVGALAVGLGCALDASVSGSASAVAGPALAFAFGGAVGAGVFGGAALGRAVAAAVLGGALPVVFWGGALPVVFWGGALPVVFFALGLAAAVSRVSAAVFDRVFAVVAPDGAWPEPSAAVGSAARAALPLRAWLTAPAGCLPATRLGAGPVPPPVELSPVIPFSGVTGP